MFAVIVFLRCVISGRFSLGYYEPGKLLLLLYLLFFYYSLFIYISSRKSKNNYYTICLYSILLSLFISNLVSIFYELFIYRHVIREALNSIYIGSGDFELVYANVLFIGLSVYYLLNNKLTKKYFYVFCTLLSSILLVIISDFMIAIIFAILFCILAIYFKYVKKMLPLFIFSLVLIFLILIFRTQISDLVIYISDLNLLSEYMNMKLEFIANFLNGSGFTESLGTRIMLITMSITAFIKYPFFGIPYTLYNGETLGLHTEWFDNLGYYGIIGTFVVFLIYYSIYKYISNHCENDKTYAKLAFLSIFLLGFMNPILSGANLVVILGCTLFMQKKEVNIKFENNMSSRYSNIEYKALITNQIKENVKISIVIPTYNRYGKLLETVKSIICMDDVDYEILIMDNDSNYSEEEISYFNTINNLNYYKNESNIGMFGNINRAAILAKGKYISFLHDDDLLCSNYFSVIRGIINQSDNMEIYIPTYNYFGNGKQPIPITSLERKIGKIFSFRFLYREKKQEISNNDIIYSRRNIFGPPSCGMLIRKDIFLNEGGFNEEFYPSSDFEFFLRLNEKYKIIRINVLISLYRWEENESLSSKTQDDFAFFNLILYAKYGSKNFFYRFFKNEIQYGITNRSLKSEYFIDKLESNSMSQTFKCSKIKYGIYNSVRMVYFYFNNLDTIVNTEEKK